MVTRHSNHRLGSSGAPGIMAVFENLGCACSTLTADNGFLVFGESVGRFEPFKLFVQVKSVAQSDQALWDWTQLEDPSTVGNWILANDLTILVRQSQTSGETRYCVPEEDILYWEIDPCKNVALHCSKQFDVEAARALIWRGRIRHYDRIVRITQPNRLEKSTWCDVPQFRLFVRDFLARLALIDQRSGQLADEVFTLQLPLMLRVLEEEGHPDCADVSALEKARYAACAVLVLIRLQKVSGCSTGLMPFFLDQCACLLAQMIRDRVDDELA